MLNILTETIALIKSCKAESANFNWKKNLYDMFSRLEYFEPSQSGMVWIGISLFHILCENDKEFHLAMIISISVGQNFWTEGHSAIL